MNKFMGIKALGDYVCYKILKDKMIALTFKGELQCWNILTGKPISTVQLEDTDFTNYELVSKYKKDAVLIRSKNKLDNVKVDDFFFP
jgi:hypothetical protein